MTTRTVMMTTSRSRVPSPSVTITVREEGSRLLVRWHSADYNAWRTIKLDFLARFGSHHDSCRRRDGWYSLGREQRERLITWLDVLFPHNAITWIVVGRAYG